VRLFGYSFVYRRLDKQIWQLYLGRDLNETPVLAGRLLLGKKEPQHLFNHNHYYEQA